MNLRRLALDLLARWDEGDVYINLAVGRACEALPDSERRTLTALLYGTVEKCITLDYFIGTLAKRGDVDPYTRNLLRLGLYEVLYMRTPAHAAVNETVKLARNRGEAGFVNGILRAAARAPQTLTPPPREKNPARYLSVAYSVPLKLVRLLVEALGEQTEAFLQAVTTPSGMTLHINTTQISREEYLAALKDRGIEAHLTPYAPRGVILARSYPPRELPGFEEGWFFVQDEASQVAVSALAPAPHTRVLDLCACPGGKSFGCAVAMGDTGEVRAFDLHASKLSLIKDGAARLKLRSVTAEEQDAAHPSPALAGQGEYVLCDVPCSGLGVLSKKADLRYRDTEGIAALPPLQLSILSAGAACLAPGGTLLYSTCTVNPKENEGVTDAFLASHPDFAYVPFEVGSLRAPEGRLTLLPHIHHTDGFYIAKLKRRVP